MLLQLTNCAVTQSVWQICVFPVRNSPYSSVIDPVSMPPINKVSRAEEPVDKEIIDSRYVAISVAVVKPMGTIFLASAMIFNPLASLIPLTSHSLTRGTFSWENVGMQQQTTTTTAGNFKSKIKQN